MTGESVTYSQMMKELETIMAQIGNQNIDVDVLIENVRRASELITACKAKLKGSEQVITGIINSMNEQPCSEEHCDL